MYIYPSIAVTCSIVALIYSRKLSLIPSSHSTALTVISVLLLIIFLISALFPLFFCLRSYRSIFSTGFAFFTFLVGIFCFVSIHIFRLKQDEVQSDFAAIFQKRHPDGKYSDDNVSLAANASASINRNVLIFLGVLFLLISIGGFPCCHKTSEEEDDETNDDNNYRADNDDNDDRYEPDPDEDFH